MAEIHGCQAARKAQRQAGILVVDAQTQFERASHIRKVRVTIATRVPLETNHLPARHPAAIPLKLACHRKFEPTVGAP